MLLVQKVTIKFGGAKDPEAKMAPTGMSKQATPLVLATSLKDKPRAKATPSQYTH